ncbi:hypothetical protein SALBM135S_08468 [Streptomyces alboniger]
MQGELTALEGHSVALRQVDRDADVIQLVVEDVVRAPDGVQAQGECEAEHGRQGGGPPPDRPGAGPVGHLRRQDRRRVVLPAEGVLVASGTHGDPLVAGFQARVPQHGRGVLLVRAVQEEFGPGARGVEQVGGAQCPQVRGSQSVVRQGDEGRGVGRGRPLLRGRAVQPDALGAQRGQDVPGGRGPGEAPGPGAAGRVVAGGFPGCPERAQGAAECVREVAVGWVQPPRPALSHGVAGPRQVRDEARDARRGRLQGGRGPVVARWAGHRDPGGGEQCGAPRAGQRPVEHDGGVEAQFGGEALQLVPGGAVADEMEFGRQVAPQGVDRPQQPLTPCVVVQTPGTHDARCRRPTPDLGLGSGWRRLGGAGGCQVHGAGGAQPARVPLPARTGRERRGRGTRARGGTPRRSACRPMARPVCRAVWA